MKRSPSRARPATFSSAAVSKYVYANPQAPRRPGASRQRRRPRYHARSAVGPHRRALTWLALLANLPVTVLRAPSVTIAVGISEVTSVLAALFVGVRDRNANHVALGIGEHHHALRPSNLDRSQQNCSDDKTPRQDSRHASPDLICLAQNGRHMCRIVILALQS